MTIRQITFMGNPVLAARATEVAVPAAPEIHALAQDMIATMREAGGIGIAAPQVGESLRIIAVLPLASREEAGDVEPLVLVNPEVQPVGKERDEDIEGCLSIPGIRGIVPRWSKVAWKARGLNGEAIGGEAQGLFARILQHEVDHLNGILFLSRMPDITRLAMRSEVHHLTRTAGPTEDRRA
jgi:peptide deformylase